MAHDEKALILRPVEWSEHALEVLSAAHAYDTTGGLWSPQDYAEGRAQGVLFAVERAGAPVAYYVLAINAAPGGSEGVIAWAAGHAGVDLVAECLPAVERQFVGCRMLKVETRRRGLVKKLMRQGWQCDGVIMRKAVPCETQH